MVYLILASIVWYVMERLTNAWYSVVLTVLYASMSLYYHQAVYVYIVQCTSFLLSLSFCSFSLSLSSVGSRVRVCVYVFIQ